MLIGLLVIGRHVQLLIRKMGIGLLHRSFMRVVRRIHLVRLSILRNMSMDILRPLELNRVFKVSVYKSNGVH